MRSTTLPGAFAAILALAAVALGCSRALSPAAGALATRFQAELDALRQEYDLPAVTAAYLLPDEPAEVFASGQVDRELRIPASPETRMMSGSTGKTFVAALALALQQEGKLSLDDPISRWLGEEPWFARLANGPAITVRMLLNHSSGLADHVYAEEFGRAIARLAPSQVLSPADLVAFILDREPLFAAGQGFAYSDTNYILAGLILEQVGGAPYYEQIQARFLYPLDLSLTAPSPGRIHPGLAQGYLGSDTPLAGLPRTMLDHGLLRFDPGTEWTGGGLVTSPRDLVRWASALYGGRVIGPEAVEEMVKSVAPGSGEDGRLGYGLGVYIWTGDHGTEYGHGGWFPGYRTSMAFYPERRVAFSVQTSTDAIPGEDVHRLRSALERLVLARPRQEPRRATP